MTTASPRRGGPATRSAGGAMLRGLLLILVAVALGVVVLRATDDPAAVADDQPVVVTAPVVEEDRLGRQGTDPAGDDDPTGGVETGADEESATEGDEGSATETEGDDETETGSATEGDDEGDDETAAGSSTTTTTVAGQREPEDVSVLVANGSGVAGLARDLSDQVGAAGYETAEPANISEDDAVSSSTVYYADGYEAEAESVAATLSPRPPVAPMPDPAPVADLRGATVLVVVGPDLADD
jgi:hypothetical protein